MQVRKNRQDVTKTRFLGKKLEQVYYQQAVDKIKFVGL